MQQKPKKLPTLTSPRIILRAPTTADADALWTIYGDAEVMRFAADPPFPDRAAVMQLLRSMAALLATGESLEWVVVEVATQRVVGTCGLHSFDEAAGSAEVGCLLARAAWGRGLMTDALELLIAYARESLGVVQLRAEIDAPNLRSQRLFTQLGFRPNQDGIYVRNLAAG